MGLLGLVGWELIHVSTELICVQYRLVKVRMASPRRLGGWKGVERLALPCRLKNYETNFCISTGMLNEN
jgi:hypothetical protein